MPIEKRLLEYHWISDVLFCLDKSSLKEGNLPLHQAVIIGNVEILEFLIKQYKERDRISKNFKNLYPKYENVLEFTNLDSMTPVILAAKYNNLLCAIMLVEEGANIHVVDNKMQNVLFYAIMNENEKMIRYFISKDE